MKKIVYRLFAVLFAAGVLFTACEKDKDPVTEIDKDDDKIISKEWGCQDYKFSDRKSWSDVNCAFHSLNASSSTFLDKAKTQGN